MISVDEVMISKVFTLKPTDSVYDARILMKEKDIRHIPIIDETNRLVGLVSQRDILSASESTLHATSSEQRISLEKQHKIEEVMTRQVQIVDERDSLRSAAMRLRKFKHGCMPVVTNGELKGIITDTDFVGVAVHLLQQMEDAIPVEEF